MAERLPRLDTIQILRDELGDEQRWGRGGVPVGCVAALASVPSGRISRYLNGSERCGAEHDQRLRAAWTSLKKLITLVAPVPINYARVAELRQSIDRLEQGTWFVVVGNNGSTDLQSGEAPAPEQHQ
jgi:hypothetical protein